MKTEKEIKKRIFNLTETLATDLYLTLESKKAFQERIDILKWVLE